MQRIPFSYKMKHEQNNKNSRFMRFCSAQKFVHGYSGTGGTKIVGHTQIIVSESVVEINETSCFLIIYDFITHFFTGFWRIL